MRKTLLRVLTVAVVLSPAVAFTQSKPKPTAAIYITKEEVDIVNTQGQGTDRNIRVVDIGQENFAVGIIHRGPTAPAGGAARGAAPAAGGGAPTLTI